MIYEYILVRYGEIALKGKNRNSFEEKLVKNIRIVLREFQGIKVSKTYGRIYVHLNGVPHESVIQSIRKVFGVHSLSLVIKTDIELESIKKTALELVQKFKTKPKSFKVVVKRPYKPFPYNSPEIADIVGRHILINTDEILVDVHNPEITVHIEIREEGVYIFNEIIKGFGGMPGDSAGRGLVLLSGGIDSPVATWLGMKKGLMMEGIHFHTYPITTEESIRKVLDLSKILSNYSGQFKIHLVPFLEVQSEIRKYAPESHYITIMRRMFLRIAEKLAQKNNVLALVTGESLGQVASQTLQSMNTINNVTNMPIIRPLITMDKIEIIKLAEEIGTFETSIRPFEDCCSLFVPKNPATKPSLHICDNVEKYIPIEDLIDEALEKTKTLTITPYFNINALNIID
ncbi:MAG: tRNA uracil 4-sulfurtransferase ThiI [Vulcanibacillus sp.]